MAYMEDVGGGWSDREMVGIAPLPTICRCGHGMPCPYRLTIDGRTRVPEEGHMMVPRLEGRIQRTARSSQGNVTTLPALLKKKLSPNSCAIRTLAGRPVQWETPILLTRSCFKAAMVSSRCSSEA